MCVSNLFLEQITPPPKKDIILCKLACKVKEIETYHRELKWWSAVPIPYVHAHQHITKDYG